MSAMTGLNQTFELSAIAACPYSITADYVMDYLLRFNAATSELILVLPDRFFTRVLPGGLRRQVHIDVKTVADSDSGSRTHEALQFQWQVRSRYLPVLRGVLRFRIADGFETRLMLSCGYRMAPGPIHRMFDRVIGRRVARATGRALLARIVANVEARERDFRSALAATVPEIS